jgi:hypothetical protein
MDVDAKRLGRKMNKKWNTWKENDFFFCTSKQVYNSNLQTGFKKKH